MSVNPLVRYRQLKSSFLMKDFSRRDASLALGISYPLVAKIESGQRLVSRKTAKMILSDPDVGSMFDYESLVAWEPSALSSKVA